MEGLLTALITFLIVALVVMVICYIVARLVAQFFPAAAPMTWVVYSTRCGCSAGH